MAEIRAKDVEVVQRWQARCKITGCDWKGHLAVSYQLANQERLEHLAEHRAAAE